MRLKMAPRTATGKSADGGIWREGLWLNFEGTNPKSEPLLPAVDYEPGEFPMPGRYLIFPARASLTSGSTVDVFASLSAFASKRLPKAFERDTIQLFID